MREVTNHGGFGSTENVPRAGDEEDERGNGRNGPRVTDRSTRSSSSALWTMPMPLCTSSIVAPGNAPQVIVGVRKMNAVQALTAMPP